MAHGVVICVCYLPLTANSDGKHL